MARIRAMRKPRVAKSTVARTPDAIKSLLSRARFGKSRRYAGGRPRKTPSVAAIVEAIVKRPRGRPRKTPVAVAKTPEEIKSLLSRARFGKSRRYAGGRPRKTAN